MKSNTAIIFQVKGPTTYGEGISVVGNNSALGNWDVSKAIYCSTNAQKYPVWESRPINIPALNLEYKYVKMRENSLVGWENFSGNRVINQEMLEAHSKLLVIDAEFDKKIPPRMEGERRGEYQTPRKGDKVRRHSNTYEDYKSHSIDFSNLMCSTINILRDRNPSAKNWKQKLELVQEILENVELENKELAAIGGYLGLVSNGQIPCEEDGAHYRPNHHAETSLKIYKFLVNNLTEENSFLIKRILKNLPSFSSKFRSDVPLTRIRDIAHRNDIPKELKTEIKTSNKICQNYLCSMF